MEENRDTEAAGYDGQSTSDQIQHDGSRFNWKWLNLNNTAADFPILLKFGA